MAEIKNLTTNRKREKLTFKKVGKYIVKGFGNALQGLGSWLGLDDEVLDAAKWLSNADPEKQAAKLINLYAKYADQFSREYDEIITKLNEVLSMYGKSPTIDKAVSNFTKSLRKAQTNAKARVDALNQYGNIINSQSQSLINQRAGDLISDSTKKQDKYTTMLKDTVSKLQEQYDLPIQNNDSNNNNNNKGDVNNEK